MWTHGLHPPLANFHTQLFPVGEDARSIEQTHAVIEPYLDRERSRLLQENPDGTGDVCVFCLLVQAGTVQRAEVCQRLAERQDDRVAVWIFGEPGRDRRGD